MKKDKHTGLEKYSYEIGAVFRNYTIVGPETRDKHGHIRWQVQCNCGRKYNFSKKQLQSKMAQQTEYCIKCMPKKESGKKKPLELYMLPEMGIRFITGKL